MGKILAEAAGEIEKSAVTADFYAGKADDILGDDGRHRRRGRLGRLRAHRAGLAVMPWNFPFWQAMRFAIPAITAGNGVFLKHSPNVTGSALAIQEVFEQAGLPAGVFTTSWSRRRECRRSASA